jgi:hypothetical protein
VKIWENFLASASNMRLNFTHAFENAAAYAQARGPSVDLKAQT